MPIEFWDLLQAWLDTNYKKYGNFQFIKPEDNPHSVEGGRWTHKIKCMPCKSSILLKWDPPHTFSVFSFDVIDYRPQEPTFSFEEALSIKLNQHLWHHQKGPLYTEGWRPDRGVGSWG